MQNVVDAILSENLATKQEVVQIVDTLNTGIHDAGTFASVTRIVQVWGRRAM